MAPIIADRDWFTLTNWIGCHTNPTRQRGIAEAIGKTDDPSLARRVSERGRKRTITALPGEPPSPSDSRPGTSRSQGEVIAQ